MAGLPAREMREYNGYRCERLRDDDWERMTIRDVNVTKITPQNSIKEGHSYEDAKSQEASNHWSVTEYNSNNAWNVNFGSGNVNNNNKYNGNVARAVAAYGELFYPFFLSVWDAYQDCLRGKMSSTQALQYMGEANEDLVVLAVELWTGTYKPGTSTCFLVTYPKLREVFAAAFRDRIVHHWVCMRLEPLFEERFERQGNVSFNCRKGYGTEAAVQHAAEGMREISNGYRENAWVFKGDLSGFFMSIDKDLLWYLLERFIMRWRRRYERNGWKDIGFDILDRLGMNEMPNMYWDVLLRTTKIIVMHHPEEDCVLNSNVEMWKGLAMNKSMFGVDTGEPIGNLTTQLFANFLMSFFDMYVMFLFRRYERREREKLFDQGVEYRGGSGWLTPRRTGAEMKKEKEMGNEGEKGKTWMYYERFVDDFDVRCKDAKYLKECIPKMDGFLRKMKLKLHKDKRYLQPVSHGMMFVGTYIKPGRLYLSNSTRARMKERCEGFKRFMEEKDELNALDCQRMEQVINSYLGFCKGRETYRFRRECIDGMGSIFWKYFYVRGRYRCIRAKHRYRAISV